LTGNNSNSPLGSVLDIASLFLESVSIVQKQFYMKRAALSDSY